MSTAPEVGIDGAALARLRQLAETHGLCRLGIVSLRHPGFRAAGEALGQFVQSGRHGEMEFLARTESVRRDPTRMLPDAASVLVAVVPHGGEAGPVARYAQFADYHTVLHRRLQALEAAVRDRVPGASTQVCVDTKPLMERAAACLAGVGVLGKNGCLIVPGLGSHVLIGSILTDAHWLGPGYGTGPDPAASGAAWDACGSCTLCLQACPTDAFDAPGVVDSRRCISYLTIEHRGEIAPVLADAMGERVAGCDVCQEVCPYNASAERLQRAPAQAWLQPPPGPDKDHRLQHLAGLGSGRYRAFVRGTALTRIPRRHLRRNALIALGNRQGPLSPAEREVVGHALEDREPQVRMAAARALRRREGQGGPQAEERTLALEDAD